MADQTQRLEIATVKAEIGSDILSRFSNDAVAADPIPTDSGDIQNLKQVIADIQQEGAEKISFATTIYPTTAAGIAATTDGAIFLVKSVEADEIYAVWQNVAGVATDTGKRALSSQAVEDAMQAATDAAEAAQDSADIATARTAGFLAPAATPPAVRDDSTPLQIGDRYLNTVDQAEYIYKSSGWELNDSLEAIDAIADITDLSKGGAMVGRSIQTFNSVAQLVTVAGRYSGELAYLIGWHEAEPGLGGGEVIWKPASVKTADNGKVFAVTGVATGRWERPTDPRCPTEYGAYGDNVADDYDALQRCVNNNSVVTSNSNFTFRHTQTLTFNTQAQIIALNKATLNFDDPTGLLDGLLVGGNPAVKRTGVTLRDFIVTRQQLATAGAGLHLLNTGTLEIEQIRIYGNSKIWNGIVNESGIINNIKNCHIDNCRNWEVYCFGVDATTGRTIDTTITGCRLEGGVNAIRTYDFVEGLFVKDDIIYNTSAQGVVIDASSNANGLISFKLQNTDIDTCGNTCLYMDKVSNFQITDLWTSSGGATAGTVASILIGVDASDGIISASQIYGRTGKINILINGKDVTVSGGNVINGGLDAIVLGSGIADINITGNNFAGFTQYGINAFTNPTGGWTESGNNFALAGAAIAVGNSGTNCIYGRSKGGFYASATFDPPSIAAGGATATNVTLATAAIGDLVQVSFSSPLLGAYIGAEVSTAGQVHVEFRNPTTGALDIASGTLRVSVVKMR